MGRSDIASSCLLFPRGTLADSQGCMTAKVTGGQGSGPLQPAGSRRSLDELSQGTTPCVIVQRGDALQARFRYSMPVQVGPASPTAGRPMILEASWKALQGAVDACQVCRVEP